MDDPTELEALAARAAARDEFFASVDRPFATPSFIAGWESALKWRATAGAPQEAPRSTPEWAADFTNLDRHIAEWRAMPITGHGLYARYQDSIGLLDESEALLRRAWADVQQLRDALTDVLAVIDGDEPDYSDCPWRLGTGICISGCSQEPACADTNGWPIERARALIAAPEDAG